MPAPLLTAAGQVLCPHAAPAQAIPSQFRVLVAGEPALVLSDLLTVAGCPLSSAVPPSPCVTISWLVGSASVFIGGQPAVLQQSMGLAKNPAQVPQGPPTISPAQARVLGS
jgi:hypothetical protein